MFLDFCLIFSGNVLSFFPSFYVKWIYLHLLFIWIAIITHVLNSAKTIRSCQIESFSSYLKYGHSLDSSLQFYFTSFFKRNNYIFIALINKLRISYFIFIVNKNNNNTNNNFMWCTTYKQNYSKVIKRPILKINFVFLQNAMFLLF